MKLLTKDSGRGRLTHWYTRGIDVRFTPGTYEADLPRDAFELLVDKAIAEAARCGRVIDFVEFCEEYVFVHCRHGTSTILIKYDESDLGPLEDRP